MTYDMFALTSTRLKVTHKSYRKSDMGNNNKNTLNKQLQYNIYSTQITSGLFKLVVGFNGDIVLQKGDVAGDLLHRLELIDIGSTVLELGRVLK